MFGVTLWEMFTFGQDPWAGLSGLEVRLLSCSRTRTYSRVNLKLMLNFENIFIDDLRGTQ